MGYSHSEHRDLGDPMAKQIKSLTATLVALATTSACATSAQTPTPPNTTLSATTTTSVPTTTTPTRTTDPTLKESFQDFVGRGSALAHCELFRGPSPLLTKGATIKDAQGKNIASVLVGGRQIWVGRGTEWQILASNNETTDGASMTVSVTGLSSGGHDKPIKNDELYCADGKTLATTNGSHIDVKIRKGNDEASVRIDSGEDGAPSAPGASTSASMIAAFNALDPNARMLPRIPSLPQLPSIPGLPTR